MANFAARRFVSSTALLRPHRASTSHVQTTSGSLASSSSLHKNNNNLNLNKPTHHHDSVSASTSAQRHISSRPSTNMGWASTTLSTTNNTATTPAPGVSILASPAMRATHPTASLASFSVPTYPCTKSAIARAFKQNTAMNQDRAFAVNDVGVVERQYARWAKELPRVHPFYAVKCNPDENLLKVLAGQGAGFDVASGAEMESALAMGVSVEDIIFANPIKSVADLRYARKVGVKKMTFDNEAELLKIKEHFPEAELVMRLLPDDSGSVMRFGIKFGTPQPHIRPLLELAQRTNMRVIGTSFHIGSGCFDAQSYAKALKLCREVFDLAADMGMTRFHYLDIGGGFPGNPVPNAANGKVPSFEAMTAVIRDSLDTLFSAAEFPHLRIIGEPGRYMATAWSTLFVYVQGKREEPVDPSNPTGPRKFLYYVNDGVYGSFNCIMFDHAHPEPIPAFRFMSNRLSLADKKVQAHAAATNMSVPMFHMPVQQGLDAMGAASSASASAAVHRGVHSSSGRDQNTLATFFGPTCDSMDCLAKDFPLEELFVGDWVAFEQMGAYTNAAATTFNGMPKASATLVRSKQESPFVPVA